MFIPLEALTEALVTAESFEEFRVKALKLALRHAEAMHLVGELHSTEGDTTGSIPQQDIETQHIDPLREVLSKLPQTDNPNPTGEHHE